MGQGNPAVTEHPATAEEAVRREAARAGVSYEQPGFGSHLRRPLHGPALRSSGEKPQDARACIDQFEFPDIPCAYPVVWVRAREAALSSARRRASGSATPTSGRAPAPAGSSRPTIASTSRRAREPSPRSRPCAPPQRAHAREQVVELRSRRQDTASAPPASRKTPGCHGGDWAHCGSNTYPAGSFPGCHSAFGVYDLNGNAAEHMNLPLDPSQMASRGSRSSA